VKQFPTGSGSWLQGATSFKNRCEKQQMRNTIAKPIFFLRDTGYGSIRGLEYNELRCLAGFGEKAVGRPRAD
jgi:hypothetical protein